MTSKYKALTALEKLHNFQRDSELVKESHSLCIDARIRYECAQKMLEERRNRARASFKDFLSDAEVFNDTFRV